MGMMGGLGGEVEDGDDGPDGWLGWVEEKSVLFPSFARRQIPRNEMNTYVRRPQLEP
jgi:hypothetical protein